MVEQFIIEARRSGTLEPVFLGVELRRDGSLGVSTVDSLPFTDEQVSGFLKDRVRIFVETQVLAERERCLKIVREVELLIHGKQEEESEIVTKIRGGK